MQITDQQTDLLVFSPEKTVIELNCTGKLEGMQIKVEEDMIARISFNKAAGHTVIQLKEDQSCEVFSNKRLVGGLPCGSEVAVEGKLQEVRAKLGLPNVGLKF